MTYPDSELITIYFYSNITREKKSGKIRTNNLVHWRRKCMTTTLEEKVHDNNTED